MTITDVIQLLCLAAIILMLIVLDQRDRIIEKQKKALWAALEMNESMLQMLVELIQRQAVANEDYETAKRCQDILDQYKKK